MRSGGVRGSCCCFVESKKFIDLRQHQGHQCYSVSCAAVPSSASSSSSLILRSAPVSGNHSLVISSGKMALFNNHLKPFVIVDLAAMASCHLLAIQYDRKKISSIYIYIDDLLLENKIPSHYVFSCWTVFLRLSV